MVCPHKSARRVIGLVLLVLVAVAAGWFIGGRMGAASSPDAGETAAAPGNVYPDIAGRVVRIAPEDGVVTVDHEEIEGFMAAMVMDLRAADPRELADLAPEDHIRFDLVKLDGQFVIVRIRKAQASGDTGAAAPPRGDALGRGDLIPDLTLIDTQGRRFHLNEIASRHKLVTFFYARCPLEHFCPAQSRRLAQLQELIRASGTDLHLVSLTLDAGHDSPDILAGYAERFGADPAHWTLAGGDDPAAIRDFADRVGAQVQPRTGGYQIDHALVAVRLDGNRIVDQVYGLEAMERLVRGVQPAAQP